MYTRNQIVTVFGGTGFLGRYVVRKLVQAGFIIRVAVRHPKKGIFLKTMGEVGQIEVIPISILDQEALEKALEGATYAVNCVGILYQTSSQKFSKIHALAPAKIAEIAKQKGLKRFVHVSSLGADLKASARYLKTKAQGEQAALEAFPQTVVVRPSVLFGFEDQFVNRFAKMMAFWHVVPLIGGGRTKLQPVYVGDVAHAIVKILCTPDLPHTQPCIFELGGPEVFSFHEIQKKIRRVIRKKIFFIPIPFFIAYVLAFFLQLISGRLLTIDQLKMLKRSNILTHKHFGFRELDIKPCSFEEWLPVVLSRFFAAQRTHPFSTLS